MISPQSVSDVVNGGVLLGHYRAALITGLTTGMAANAPIVSLRWTDAGQAAAAPGFVYVRPRLLLLLGIDVGAVVTTAFTGAQPTDFECIKATGFTASDTGGTQITAAQIPKMRSTFGTSLVGDLRRATTSALGAGTRTLDTIGFAAGPLYNQNTGGSGETLENVYSLSRNGQYPLTLTTNEGIIVRVPTAQGAVGVVQYYVTMEWIEVSVEGATGFHPE